jgi:hypothetical protein
MRFTPRTELRYTVNIGRSVEEQGAWVDGEVILVADEAIVLAAVWSRDKCVATRQRTRKAEYRSYDRVV